MVMARMTIQILARVSDMSAMASRMPGMAINPSMTRIRMASAVRK